MQDSQTRFHSPLRQQSSCAVGFSCWFMIQCQICSIRWCAPTPSVFRAETTLFAPLGIFIFFQTICKLLECLLFPHWAKCALKEDLFFFSPFFLPSFSCQVTHIGIQAWWKQCELWRFSACFPELYLICRFCEQADRIKQREHSRSASAFRCHGESWPANPRVVAQTAAYKASIAGSPASWMEMTGEGCVTRWVKLEQSSTWFWVKAKVHLLRDHVSDQLTNLPQNKLKTRECSNNFPAFCKLPFWAQSDSSVLKIPFCFFIGRTWSLFELIQYFGIQNVLPERQFAVC